MCTEIEHQTPTENDEKRWTLRRVRGSGSMAKAVEKSPKDAER
jgi:hypothetical protein